MPDNFVSALHEQLRTKNAIPPLLALLIGYNFNGRVPGSSRELIAGSLCIILLMFYATLSNDAEDYQLDASANRKSPLVQKRLNISAVRGWAYACLAAAIAAAILSGSTDVIVFG